jgi:hypothetical protein
MGLNYLQLTRLAGQLGSVATLIEQTKSMASQLKTEGTVLYQNADLLEQFPNDGPALRTQLVTVGNTLTAFLAALNQITPPNS